MIFRAAVLLVVCSVAGAAQESFEVIRKKPLWPNSQGTLVISDDSIEFRRKKEEDSKRWSYRDIQHFDRISPSEIEILTYEDAAWRLGEDRAYRFSLVSGEIDDALFESMADKLGLPVTDRIANAPSGDATRIPVKHLKTFGGSEGELVFGESAVSYVTDAPRQAREWLIDRDVESVWAASRYELELHVFEAGRRDFDSTQVYRFQLKRELDPALYRDLKMRLYKLRSDERLIP